MERATKMWQNLKLPEHGDPCLVQLVIRRQRLSLAIEGIDLGWRQTHLVQGCKQMQVENVDFNNMKKTKTKQQL